jgi:hypothetical protein
MSSLKPWITDNSGNKMEIPEELYPKIRKMIYRFQKENLSTKPSLKQNEIIFGPILKGQKIDFFKSK